jgi:hypothetical protein
MNRALLIRSLFVALLVTCGQSGLGAVTLSPQEALVGKTSEHVYYVWDTGDGRLIPTARGLANHSAGITLPYWTIGNHRPTWTAVTLSGRTFSGRGRLVSVAADAEAPGEPVDVVSWRVIQGSKSDKQGDGPFPGAAVEGPSRYEPGAVELRLDGLQRIDWVVLVPPKNGEFPRQFAVQIQSREDGAFHPVPSAEFPFFPSPENHEIWIPLHGAAATGVRLFVPRGNGNDEGTASWAVGPISLRGGQDLPWQIQGAGDLTNAAWNNQWLIYGLAQTEVHDRFDPWWPSERPLDGGLVGIGSCEWLYWNALKLSWLGAEHPEAKVLASYIAGNPIDEKGFAWASPASERHLEHSRHYTTNAMYVMAVAHHYLMTRDREFLEKKDPKTGESILSKARRAMNYQLKDLQGENGLLVFPGPENDGTATSLGSNYWDFWLFGHKSAYGNALFYDSLRLMAELESALGETESADRLRKLRPVVQEKYNAAFWDPDKGRYIGWIDAEGKHHDYGFTFVNLHALQAGMADSDQAEQILSWLDGTRIVESDDASDLYAFGFAPRSTTVDARRGDPPMVVTWGGELQIGDNGNAEFGRQIQNGGAIFYVSYYDLHARYRYRSAGDAAKRWEGIESEYAKDQIRRDPDNSRGHSDIVGILREFPESGLVPYFFIDGVIGASPVAEGLLFRPGLFPGYEKASAVVHFAGQEWKVTVEAGLSAPQLDGTQLRLPAQGAWVLTTDRQIQSWEAE